MPPYTAAVLSDQDLGDIYSYLVAIPPLPDPAAAGILNNDWTISGIDLGGRRFCGDTQFGGQHERRAALVVVIFDLAVHALEAFGRDDLAGFFNRPYRA